MTRFEDIIGRATFEGFDRDLLAQGAGDENERHLRAPVASQFQGSVSVKARKGIIGQDQFGRIMLQLTDVIGSRLNAFEGKVHTALKQGEPGQLGVRRIVLQH